MTFLSLTLFGQFECCTNEGTRLTFATRKVRALFASLATRPGHCYGREKADRSALG
jgi:hypothetical protein